MFHPKTKRKIAATILPSLKRVNMPNTQDVIGMIAKIKLTIQLKPK